MWFGKNMAKLSKTRHFIPIIIIPSKVLIEVKCTKRTTRLLVRQVLKCLTNPPEANLAFARAV